MITNFDITLFMQRAESFKDNGRMKGYIQSEIFQMRDQLQDSFLRKIKTGKINKDHILPQIVYLQELIKEFNKIQVYEVKNGIVTPRFTTTFPETSFETDLNKGNCQKNLNLLSQFKY